MEIIPTACPLRRNLIALEIQIQLQEQRRRMDKQQIITQTQEVVVTVAK